MLVQGSQGTPIWGHWGVLGAREVLPTHLDTLDVRLNRWGDVSPEFIVCNSYPEWILTSQYVVIEKMHNGEQIDLWNVSNRMHLLKEPDTWEQVRKAK